MTARLAAVAAAHARIMARRRSAVALLALLPLAFTVISALLPFHDARQLLDAAVSAPAAVWPRLAVTAAYAAALTVVSWTAWRARAAATPQR